MFLVDAFNNSDIVGQGIVVLLLVANCWCWSQVANKRLDTAGIRTRCRRFLECFKKHKFEVPLRIFAELGNKKFASPLAELTKAVRDTLLATLKVDSAQKARLVEDGVLPRPLKQSELDGLRVSLNRALTQQVINLESGMTGMSTIISLSPMLGLFGTVWGVLKTFVGINNAGGRPDIAAIAPGISAALLTTVGGLFVAIPAIFLNNFSVKTVNDIINDLELYSEDLFTAVQNASEIAAQEEAQAAEAKRQAAYAAPPAPPQVYAEPRSAEAPAYAAQAPQPAAAPQPPPLQRPIPPPASF